MTARRANKPQLVIANYLYIVHAARRHPAILEIVLRPRPNAKKQDVGQRATRY